MHKNAEICNALVATQHSRGILEREIISLKRNLHEERSRATTTCDTLTQSLYKENKLVVSENELLKARFDRAHKQKVSFVVILLQEIVNISSCLQNEELESYKNEIDNLRQSQLTEIDLRCREVDSLKEQLSNRLETLQEDSESLVRQVSDLSTDKRKLVDQISCLESKLKFVSEQSKSKNSKLQHDNETLEVRVTKLSELTGQLKVDNATLRAKQRFVG